MKIDSLTSSLVSLMESNNTITSGGLSNGLLDNKKITTFHKGIENTHVDYPIPKTLFPYVFVEAVESEYQFNQLGVNSSRDIDILWDIVGCTMYGQGSGTGKVARENADTQALKLAGNIEDFVANNIRLGGIVQWCFVRRSEYNVRSKDNTYQTTTKVRIEARRKT